MGNDKRKRKRKKKDKDQGNRMADIDKLKADKKKELAQSAEGAYWKALSVEENIPPMMTQSLLVHGLLYQIYYAQTPTLTAEQLTAIRSAHAIAQRLRDKTAEVNAISNTDPQAEQKIEAVVF